MTHHEAIRAALVANAAVTALVGTRIYPLKAPQGVVVPFVIMATVSSIPQNSLAGSAATRLRVARVQIDAYAKSFGEAHQVADAIDVVVSDLSGSDLSAAQESSAELYDDETELRRVSTDYVVAL